MCILTDYGRPLACFWIIIGLSTLTSCADPSKGPMLAQTETSMTSQMRPLNPQFSNVTTARGLSSISYHEPTANSWSILQRRSSPAIIRDTGRPASQATTALRQMRPMTRSRDKAAIPELNSDASRSATLQPVVDKTISVPERRPNPLPVEHTASVLHGPAATLTVQPLESRSVAFPSSAPRHSTTPNRALIMPIVGSPEWKKQEDRNAELDRNLDRRIRSICRGC